MSVCGIPACTVSAHEREAKLWTVLARIRRAIEGHDAIVLRDSTDRLKQQIADILDEVEFNE